MSLSVEQQEGPENQQKKQTFFEIACEYFGCILEELRDANIAAASDPFSSILGSIAAFLVLLSPILMFYKVYKRKTTDDLDSTPYVVGLFTASLWLCYALLKRDGVTFLLISNSLGWLMHIFFICVFLYYAPKKKQIKCLMLIIGLHVIGYTMFAGLTSLLIEDHKQRVNVLGWICPVFSSYVFVEPLVKVLLQVIKTKTAKHMPILLSFPLTLCAIAWFLYGLISVRDYSIMIPNAFGFALGIVHVILWFVNKNKEQVIEEDDWPVLFANFGRVFILFLKDQLGQVDERLFYRLGL